MKESHLQQTWMQLEIIILSEVSQEEKDKYDVTYVCDLKYDTNEPTDKPASQKQRKNDWLPRGRGMGEWSGSGRLGLAKVSFYT